MTAPDTIAAAALAEAASKRRKPDLPDMSGPAWLDPSHPYPPHYGLDDPAPPDPAPVFRSRRVPVLAAHEHPADTTGQPDPVARATARGDLLDAPRPFDPLPHDPLSVSLARNALALAIVALAIATASAGQIALALWTMTQ